MPLPMFPLGSVLFPTMVLPLHIFEERYRALVADCLAGEQEFGVCLIERGFEVGGGDERTAVGTVAQIIDAKQFDDGRFRREVCCREPQLLEFLSCSHKRVGCIGNELDDALDLVLF